MRRQEDTTYAGRARIHASRRRSRMRTAGRYPPESADRRYRRAGRCADRVRRRVSGRRRLIPEDCSGFRCHVPGAASQCRHWSHTP